MAISRAIKKIGKSVVIVSTLLALTASCAALAEEPQFTAEVDRTEVSLDESVSLRLTLKADGNTKLGEPRFNAPGFTVINEYNSSFVQSTYENGKFGIKNHRIITKVLKPLKQGEQKITDLQSAGEKKIYRAPDITIHVGPAGAGSPPPRGYGGSGVGLRGAGKRINKPSVMIRAELDKEQAFKGEQVVISYYLYTRVRMFNIAVQKFPGLDGFLKEELEMAVAGGGQLGFESVIVDGVEYKRALLVRYAAYPLQEGKLKIDSLALKYTFVPNPGGGIDDEEDPFFSFFQNLAPRNGQERSEQLSLTATALPTEGKPASFTGGVGDFSVTSAVNNYDVRANEALTLTVKVEGRGNLAAIGEPKGKWPSEVELYDTKGRAKSGKAGVGEKVFEYLLIPRTPGRLELPALEFSFFDPLKKAYVTRATEPITVNVLDPAPGSALVQPRSRTAQATPTASAAPKDPELLYLKPPGPVEAPLGELPLWRWVYWLACAALGFFILLVAGDLLKKGRERARVRVESEARAHSRSWNKIREDVKRVTRYDEVAPWKEITHLYELLENAIFDSLDQRYSLGVRALPRSELSRILVQEKNLPEALWQRIERVLEFTELVRFAGTGVEEKARAELARWVDEAQSVAGLVERGAGK